MIFQLETSLIMNNKSLDETLKATLINELLNLIPGDSEFNYPSLLELNYHLVLAENQELTKWLVQSLKLFCLEHSINLGDDLELSRKVQTYLGTKEQAVQQAINELLEYYYSHPRVVGNIYGSEAPFFPKGRKIALDDLSALEPVYLRGKIYREV